MKAQLLFVMAAAISSAALAQTAEQEYRPPAKRIAPTDGLVAQLKPRGETPRLADGHPDMNGLYGGDPRWDTPYVRFTPRSLEKFEPDQVILQRGSAWSKPIYKPELWQKVHETDFGKVLDDPAFHCMPQGSPRIGAPQKIVQTAKEVVLINGSEVRYIPTDGRKRDEIDSDFDNFFGVPLGRWEGDTLVIDSVGYTDESWLQWNGYFHSVNMTLTERLTRKGDLLYYSFTVNDPEVLAQPWTSETFVKRLNPNPLARFEEVRPCKENDADQIVDPRYRG